MAVGEGQQVADPSLPAHLRIDPARLRREQRSLRPGEAPGTEETGGEGARFGLAAVAGEHDIDVAVVAFGVLTDEESVWQSHAAAMAEVRVNYLGAVSVGVCLADVMRGQGHGVIVALSSVAGERVRRSNFVYGSAKAGMDGFYLGLGEALRGSGASVLVVRPGFVRTRMTEGREPVPLAVDADTVAEAIVDGVTRRAELIWVPAPLRIVMSGLRHVPRSVFRRLPL